MKTKIILMGIVAIIAAVLAIYGLDRQAGISYQEGYAAGQADCSCPSYTCPTCPEMNDRYDEGYLDGYTAVNEHYQDVLNPLIPRRCEFEGQTITPEGRSTTLSMWLWWNLDFQGLIDPKNPR